MQHVFVDEIQQRVIKLVLHFVVVQAAQRVS